MTSAIDTIAWTASQVREAYAVIDEAMPMQVGGALYRPQLDDVRAKEASAPREGEVAAIEARHADRSVQATVVAVVALLLIVMYAFLAR